MPPKRCTTPTTATTPEGITISEIPLGQPDRGPRKDGQKTLLDIIEEKRPRIQELDGEGGEGIENDELFGPGMQTLFFAVPLTILLFWLDVLVYMQYRQELEWNEIAFRCVRAFPAIFVIHYMFHPRKEWRTVKAFLLGLSVVAGCYIVKAVNKWGYYKVMKKTPPLGTLWIWAVIELDLISGVVSCAVVAGYTWYYGYSVL